MPIITLLTDFGLADEYVGVMRGVILSVNPRAVVVDITHHIAPQQVQQAARTLAASYRYFPAGSVHVTVVDPGVGTTRRIVALRKDGHFFLAPDNGSLTCVLESGGSASAVSVENDALFLKPVSRTFHGRDIFAPVAAHISKGMPLERLGHALKPEQLVRLEDERPFVSAGGELVGRITDVDRFGNLITDIDSRTLEEFAADRPGDGLTIRLSGGSIDGLSQRYEDREAGRPLALIGSRDRLEISVCRGSAQKSLGAGIGDRVSVSRG